LAPVLLGCSAGQPAMGFIDPRLMAAYIPLSQSHDLIFSRWGAAYSIAPHVAVTNDHNLNFIDPGRVLARSHDYDLLFFRTDLVSVAPAGKARLGDAVIAYGQGRNDALRQATGKVTALNESLPARCPDCAPQRSLVFEADAGPGFSGGPVVDAATGAVLGIVFGYLDRAGAQGGRLMYAYDIDLVTSEMHRLLDPIAR
jgi:S1-C subfamily serine protease